MFSSRLPPLLTPNAVAGLVERMRKAGERIDDLTETNPTAVGLPYPPHLLDPLADPRAAVYRPEPLGLWEAREAVAETYARQGARVAPDRIVLTASTSEAYAFLFKLLCDPGDRVLVPRPSYPLFDLLAGLEGVGAAPYRLQPLDGWTIDRHDLERGLTPSTRAVLVVSPNNPTGSLTRYDDREWLADTASREGLAIIADEVFAEYLLTNTPQAVSFAGHLGALTFTLGGLSKSVGLPQVKLAWIAVSGPDALVERALERLEVIADTYLSVSTPAQIAARALIADGAAVRHVISTRLSQNLGVLRSAVHAFPAATLVEPEGGWSAVLRVPATAPEEELVLRALRDERVLVHPGYFFDFPEEAYVVVSLLPDPSSFEAGVTRLLGVIAGAAAS